MGKKNLSSPFFLSLLLINSNALIVKKKINQAKLPKCYAPAEYTTAKPINKYFECQTRSVISYSHEEFDDTKLSNCLHYYEFMDKYGEVYPITEECKRRNRFNTPSYEGKALTTATDDNYLNSALIDGELKEIDNEYIYVNTPPRKEGFIVMTSAPIGNIEDVTEDKNLNGICGANKFNLTEGKDCYSGNVKVNGKYVKDNTILSFYKNIAKNNISFVVMLTNFVEKTNNPDCNCKVKADKYFSLVDDEVFEIKNPDHVTNSGFYVISKTKTISDLNSIPDLKTILETREITLYGPDKKVVHKFMHLHFKGWPDFGVPEGQKENILFYLVDGMKFQMDDKGKNVLVHCTGGIGRTGTFVIMVLTHSLRKLSYLNLFILITEIRKQRPEAVETAEQLALIRNNLKRLSF